jgi:hypothetical protein
MLSAKILIPSIKIALILIGVVYLGLHVFAFEAFVYQKPTGLILLSVAAVLGLLLQLYTEPWKSANYIRQLIIWLIIGITFYSSLRIVSKYYFDIKYSKAVRRHNNH